MEREGEESQRETKENDEKELEKGGNEIGEHREGTMPCC